MQDLLASVIVGRYSALINIELKCNETVPVPVHHHGTVEIALLDNGTYRLDTSNITCVHCKREFESLKAVKLSNLMEKEKVHA